MLDDKDKELKKQQGIMMQMAQNIGELEGSVKRYKKNYEKAKSYTQELEQNIIGLDQKLH